MPSSIPQTSGIYNIVCVPTGKIYIGSAVNLRRRRHEHWTALRCNKHSNRYLQRAWDKYGETAFSFEVVELILSAFLLDREQYWLDKLKPYRSKGFNISATSNSPMGVKHTDEMRHARSAAQKELWESDEYRQMMIDSHKTRWDAPGHREKMGALKAQRWIVTDSLGIEQSIFNLRSFCRDHDLRHQNMLSVANGKKPQYKGWKCRRVE